VSKQSRCTSRLAAMGSSGWALLQRNWNGVQSGGLMAGEPSCASVQERSLAGRPKSTVLRTTVKFGEFLRIVPLKCIGTMLRRRRAGRHCKRKSQRDKTRTIENVCRRQGKRRRENRERKAGLVTGDSNSAYQKSDIRYLNSRRLRRHEWTGAESNRRHMVRPA
jgi:hypothetical protein